MFTAAQSVTRVVAAASPALGAFGRPATARGDRPRAGHEPGDDPRHEPTGALDTVSSAEVMVIFGRLSEQGRTIILITHESQVAAHAHRLIRLSDSRIVAHERGETRARAESDQPFEADEQPKTAGQDG